MIFLLGNNYVYSEFFIMNFLFKKLWGGGGGNLSKFLEGLYAYEKLLLRLFNPYSADVIVAQLHP